MQLSDSQTTARGVTIHWRDVVLLSIESEFVDIDVFKDVDVAAVADDVRRFAAAASTEVVELVLVAAFRPQPVVAGIRLDDHLKQTMVGWSDLDAATRVWPWDDWSQLGWENLSEELSNGAFVVGVIILQLCTTFIGNRISSHANCPFNAKKKKKHHVPSPEEWSDR